MDFLAVLNVEVGADRQVVLLDLIAFAVLEDDGRALGFITALDDDFLVVY